jgi:hypothetical protein
MDDQFQAQFAYISVTEFKHLAKFTRGVDVQQRKRRLSGKKLFPRQ